ncbi:hypothetical protein CAEBREN_05953 [Caenorhabditis brenneri]|uniref:Uncharacterized protein n=1 Tax=Caenorhabditis brenneri TaxID=135651 RepID=G0NQI6_CAEBE|nr:hypothetical protein CAEBREN_05953 [Caenorhabditis brenneri]
MSKKAIASRINVQNRLVSIRQDLEHALDILSHQSESQMNPLPIVPTNQYSTGVVEAVKEDMDELGDCFSPDRSKLWNPSDMAKDDDRLTSLYEPGTRPINNYLWWFSVKVWFQAELPSPQSSEDPKLTDDMVQRLLKAYFEVCAEVFKTENSLRQARRATIDTQRYKDLTSNQIQIILEKFTEVMLIRKEQLSSGKPGEAEETGPGLLELIRMSSSVYV